MLPHRSQMGASYTSGDDKGLIVGEQGASYGIPRCGTIGMPFTKGEDNNG